MILPVFPAYAGMNRKGLKGEPTFYACSPRMRG